MASRLTIVPCDLSEANAFILVHHRHHGAARGHKFSLAVIDATEAIRGVAIVGRPRVDKHPTQGKLRWEG